MKKIFIVLCAIFMICAMTVVAFAEDDSSASVETSAVETESLPIESENATEGEFLGTEAPVETPTETPMVTTEGIINWVETHLKEIALIITIIIDMLFTKRKHKSLNGSITTLNNNSVSAVENSDKITQAAFLKVEDVSLTLNQCKNEIVTLLAEIRQSDEEKKKLEATVTEVKDYLNTAKLANMELANEVAELLVLANIPNAKKEELYARHRAAVAAIDAAEHKNTEVKEDVGEEA